MVSNQVHNKNTRETSMTDPNASNSRRDTIALREQVLVSVQHAGEGAAQGPITPATPGEGMLA